MMAFEEKKNIVFKTTKIIKQFGYILFIKRHMAALIQLFLNFMENGII